MNKLYELIGKEIFTACEKGICYVNDDLSAKSPNIVSLDIETALTCADSYGRKEDGWYVSGGVQNSYTSAVMRSGIIIGNRSVYAKLSFISNQKGVADGMHGLYEIRLVQQQDSNSQYKPIRVIFDNGKFYILDLFSKLMAGDMDKIVFRQTENTLYTLNVLFYHKEIHAWLTGDNIPGGCIDICYKNIRLIPGYPGFALEANAFASGGGALVRDWVVTPVGPCNPIIGAIGDSITGGLEGKPEEEDYVCMVSRALGQLYVLNTGSGGSTTDLDASRFLLEIAPFKPKIIWIEGGTVDIRVTSTAEDIFKNKLKAISFIDWGGIPLLSTIPPRNDLTVPQKEKLNAVNMLIRGSGYHYVDRNVLLRDPADNDVLDPKYDEGDGIHINYTGNKLIADEAIHIVKSILDSTVKTHVPTKFR
ncbi:MAG: SGNH/GDSL hydrolase family protein [Ruminiclostridium sp.]|nr:SGNH/GDSL hydrolase family protein [Ruminiclostridium sp.]